MDVAGYPILGWLLLLAFCVFCGAAVFYLVYGAASMFRGDSGQSDAESWLLDRRTPFVAVASIVSFIVIALIAPPS